MLYHATYGTRCHFARGQTKRAGITVPARLHAVDPCRRLEVRVAAEGAPQLVLPAWEPVPVLEVETEINGTVTIAQIPDNKDVPEHVRGAKLLYAGNPAKLCGISKPLGDPYVLTGTCWDFFLLVPLLSGDGPICCLGWGGGTAPRLMLEAFDDPPVMYAWEKDPQMMEVCQVAFGADDLAEGGYIKVTLGDPLGDGVEIPEGFAGVIVDLSEAGEIPQELTKVETWRKIRAKLRDTSVGRVMARLGPATLWQGGEEQLNATTIEALYAMWEAFDGQLQYYDPRDDEDVDVMAMSGPPVDSQALLEEAPFLIPLLADWDPFDPTGEAYAEEVEEEGEEEGDEEEGEEDLDEGEEDLEEGGELEGSSSSRGVVTDSSSSGREQQQRQGEEEEGGLEVVEGEVIGPEMWAELVKQQRQQQQDSEGEQSEEE